MPVAAAKKPPEPVKEEASGLKALVRIDCFGMYNCGMGIFSNMRLRSPEGYYVNPAYLKAHKDEIIKEFLEYMNNPTAAAVLPAEKVPGVIAHYTGAVCYPRLAFWVFHDNVKGDLVDKDNPFTDLSALMAYIYHNQDKYGVTVTRSHMADNVYHHNNCSHPGRVYVLTPPAVQVLAPGVKLKDPDRYKRGIKSCFQEATGMYPDDQQVLSDLCK